VRSAHASRQLPLAIGVVEVPEELLRQAYERCRLNLSFEEAIQDPMYHKCLKNVVISGQLKRGKRR
jgi:hypothetical protein